MGFGVYSGTYKFIPRSVPVKPPTVLRNILEPAGTSQTVLHVDFDHLLDTGGSAITSYNFYLKDNGPKNINSNSAWSTLVANNVYVINGANLSQKKWASTGLTLVTGNWYKLKYSATNIHGEGPQSDETTILLAIKPLIPASLTRVDMTTLVAG